MWPNEFGAGFARRHEAMIDDCWQRLRESRRHVGAADRSVTAARQRLAASRELLSQSTVVPIGMSPGGEAVAGDQCGNEPTGNFGVMDELIAEVEQAAARDAAALDSLIAQIKALQNTDTDHHLLIGILLEGIAQAAGRIVPAVEQRDAVVALFSLLTQRLGMLCDDAVTRQ